MVEVKSWSEIEPVWRSCLALAWSAYARNTTPVGAVLVDGQGREIARGANARYASDSGAPLAGTHLAHAEIMALSALSSERRYEDYRVYTTLEPCLLCVGAAVMSFVGGVCWAGVDAYAGATSLIRRDNAHLRRGLTRFHGPRDDLVGLFASALHVEHYLRRNPAGHVVAAHQDAAPHVVRAARLLEAQHTFEAASEGAEPAQIFDGTADALSRV